AAKTPQIAAVESALSRTSCTSWVLSTSRGAQRRGRKPFDFAAIGGIVAATVKAPPIEAIAAVVRPTSQPAEKVAAPAARARPASCAIGLAALLMPDASPISGRCTLDITDAVSGAARMAKDRPSSDMGPITPIIKEACWPSAIQTYASAAPAGPAMSMGRAPILSARLPKKLERRPT